MNRIETHSSIRTTLLIPCFNEADGIPQLCDRLRPVIEGLQHDGMVEVLFVDDGSTDGTADVIKHEAGNLPYRIVTHEQNKGLGAALRTGFTASRGSEIATLDSDCTYDPAQVAMLLAKLRTGYDVVTGSPYHPEGEVVGVQTWRLLLSKTLSRLYWLILPQRLYTYTSCFRAYQREILGRLDFSDNGFLAVTKSLVTAILQGARVAEIPSRLTSRKFGQSKIRVFRVMISHLNYLFYVAWLRITRWQPQPSSAVQEVVNTKSVNYVEKPS